MIFKQVRRIKSQKVYSKNNWEEVPSEDLWEDGELSVLDLMHKIERKVLVEGSWILIRRRPDDNEHRNS